VNSDEQVVGTLPGDKLFVTERHGLGMSKRLARRRISQGGGLQSRRYALSMNELIAVATFGNHLEADLARSALTAAGIDSVVSADDAGGLRPHLAFSGGVQLLVRAEDAAVAQEVLSQPAAEPKE
jgi:hypothetical protein